MERIQQALEKARAERTGATAATAAPMGSEAAATIGAPTVARMPEAPRGPVASGAPSGAGFPLNDGVAARWGGLRELKVDAKVLARAHIVTAATGPDAGRFDLMRTKLLHQMRAHGWRRIAVTSPGPSCGKTTVSLNLAFSLARQPDLRVLLLDADLRKPTVAKVLRTRPATGLADLLEGRATVEEAVLRLRPNLAVVPNPGPRRHPAELFQAPASAEALAALEAALEPTVTLFDLPPALTGDDVLAIAEHLDGALIVAGAGTTTVAEIDACERELAARTNVVGVVVNRCRYLGNDYGYGDHA